jgi:hypothetical protein
LSSDRADVTASAGHQRSSRARHAARSAIGRARKKPTKAVTNMKMAPGSSSSRSFTAAVGAVAVEAGKHVEGVGSGHDALLSAVDRVCGCRLETTAKLIAAGLLDSGLALSGECVHFGRFQRVLNLKAP